MSSFMLEPVAQSESKASLFKRLGLDEQNGGHRRLYTMMKEEASEGWRRLTIGPQSLIPSLRDDQNLKPPRYTFAQIDEMAMRDELKRIHREASPATRIIYDLAQDPDTDGAYGNWIIRWMVWHVFRYRDERNSRRQMSSSPASASGTSGDDTNSQPLVMPSALGSLVDEDQEAGLRSGRPESNSNSLPVLQPGHSVENSSTLVSEETIEALHVDTAAPLPKKPAFWDPVRAEYR